MADGSAIEWTDATWNPVTGCAVVSPGCTNCYAMKLAGTRLRSSPSRKELTVQTKAGPVWNGKVRLNEGWLTQPLTWRRPRKIFVCAHGDLFAEGVPDEWIDRVFAVMALAPWHTFQVLTKRSARMRQWATERWQPAPAQRIPVGDGTFMDVPAQRRGETRRDRINAAMDEVAVPDSPRFWTDAGYLKARQFAFPLPNVWLGVSAENQRWADERVPDLLGTPAAVRFVSAEPLLGPIDFTSIDLDGDSHVTPLTAHSAEELSEMWGEPTPAQPRLDWIIVGGESGPGARPMRPDWARQIRDACAAAGVAFHFKQWGAWHADALAYTTPGGVCPPPEMRIGKKAAGRLLDGVEHNGFPIEPGASLRSFEPSEVSP